MNRPSFMLRRKPCEDSMQHTANVTVAAAQAKP